MIEDDVFVCACCGGLYQSGDDERARAEAAAAGHDPDDLVIVCEDCYTLLTTRYDGTALH